MIKLMSRVCDPEPKMPGPKQSIIESQAAFGVFVQGVRTKLSESDRKEGSARSGSGAAHVGGSFTLACQVQCEVQCQDVPSAVKLSMIQAPGCV